MAGVTLGNWNMEVLLSHVVYIIEVSEWVCVCFAKHYINFSVLAI